MYFAFFNPSLYWYGFTSIELSLLISDSDDFLLMMSKMADFFFEVSLDDEIEEKSDLSIRDWSEAVEEDRLSFLAIGKELELPLSWLLGVST